MKVQVSDIIAQTLVAADVKRAYGMIGYGVDVLMILWRKQIFALSM